MTTIVLGPPGELTLRHVPKFIQRAQDGEVAEAQPFGCHDSCQLSGADPPDARGEIAEGSPLEARKLS